MPINSYFRLRIRNISGEIRRKSDEFASGESLYIYVIQIGVDGGITNLYGSNGAHDPVKDEGEAVVFLRTIEPVGIEHYVVILSKDYVDFSFYETDAVNREATSTLEKLLSQSGRRTRRSGLVIRDEPNSWDIIRFDVRIVK